MLKYTNQPSLPLAPHVAIFFSAMLQPTIKHAHSLPNTSARIVLRLLYANKYCLLTYLLTYLRRSSVIYFSSCWTFYNESSDPEKQSVPRVCVCVCLHVCVLESNFFDEMTSDLCIRDSGGSLRPHQFHRSRPCVTVHGHRWKMSQKWSVVGATSSEGYSSSRSSAIMLLLILLEKRQARIVLGARVVLVLLPIRTKAAVLCRCRRRTRCRSGSIMTRAFV